MTVQYGWINAVPTQTETNQAWINAVPYVRLQLAVASGWANIKNIRMGTGVVLATDVANIRMGTGSIAVADISDFNGVAV